MSILRYTPVLIPSLTVASLFGYSYLKSNSEYLSFKVNEFQERVLNELDTRNLVDAKRFLSKVHYGRNCDAGDDSESLVCRSVDPNGEIDTYTIDNNKSIYFSKLEGIRHNKGMREAANLILDNLDSNKDELLLHYPYVGTHVAFLDMLDVLTKSGKLKKVKFLLTDEGYELDQLADILRDNILRVLQSSDSFTNLIVSDDLSIISFNLNGIPVILEIQMHEKSNFDYSSDVCIVHDPGADTSQAGVGVFNHICQSDSYVTSYSRAEENLLNHSIKPSVVVKGESYFDHGHCIFRYDGKFFIPEDYVEGNKLVFVKK